MDQIFWIVQRFLAMPHSRVLCREVWKHSQLWPDKILGRTCQRHESMPHRSHHEPLTGKHSLWLWWKLADDSIEKAHSNLCSAELLVKIWGLTLVVITMLLMYHIKKALWSSDKGSERKQDGSCSVSHFLFYGNQLTVIITYYLSFKLDLLQKKIKETTAPKKTSIARKKVKVVCGDFGSFLWFDTYLGWWFFNTPLPPPTTLAAILKWSSWPQIY